MKTLAMLFMTMFTLIATLHVEDADARPRRQHHWVGKKKAHYARARYRAPVCGGEMKACGRTTDIQQCMTCNAYREAAVEGFEGMVEVNRTVIARTKSGIFPANICSAIYQHAQFSWTFSPRTCVGNERLWQQAKLASLVALKRGGNAKMYYYANYIRRPKWAKNCVGREQLGKHIFFGSCGNTTQLAHYKRNQTRMAEAQPLFADTESAR